MLSLLFRSAVLVIVIFLAQVKSKASKVSKDIEITGMMKDIEYNCGLKGDNKLWSFCIEDKKKFDLDFNKVYIETGKVCSNANTTNNDYRCYKACHWEKLGVLDSKTGQIYPEKYFAHLDNLFEGHNKTMVENVKNNSKRCFVVDGKNVTMSLTKCEQNESIIQCFLDRYKEICRPEYAVRVLKLWQKKGKRQKCKIQEKIQMDETDD